MTRLRLCILGRKSQKWCCSHCIQSSGARFPFGPILVITMMMGLKWHLHCKVTLVIYSLLYFNWFLKTLIRAISDSQPKWEVKIFLIYPCLHTCIGSTHYQNGMYLTDISVHRNYPKFIVYLLVYSWHCAFYGFGQCM